LPQNLLFQIFQIFLFFLFFLLFFIFHILYIFRVFLRFFLFHCFYNFFLFIIFLLFLISQIFFLFLQFLLFLLLNHLEPDKLALATLLLKHLKILLKFLLLHESLLLNPGHIILNLRQLLKNILAGGLAESLRSATAFGSPLAQGLPESPCVVAKAVRDVVFV
jgi:hypothetical protein